MRRRRGASAASLRKRWTVPASARIFAAVSGPQPGRSSRAAARAATRRAIWRSSSRARLVSSLIRCSCSVAIVVSVVSSRRARRAWIWRCQTGRESAEGGMLRPSSSSWRCQRRRASSRVRSATRSSRWSSNSLISRAAGSGRAGGNCSRSAARATASASIASDLPRRRSPRRSAAISFGGTRTSRSPRASRNDSNPRLTCRQSSSAKSRSPS